MPFKNCSLVSEIDDFRNGKFFFFCLIKIVKGLAFSEILLDLYPERRDSLSKIQTLDLSYQNCLKNFDIILNVIKTSMNPPNYLETFTSEDLFENDQKLIILLAFLYNEKKNHCLSNRNKTNQQEKTQLNNKISAKKPPLAPQPQQNINEKYEISSSDPPEKYKPDFVKELNKNYNVIQPKQQNYYLKHEAPKEITNNNNNNFEHNKDEISRKATNLPTPETFIEKPSFEEFENRRKNISEKKKSNILTSEHVEKSYFKENLSFEKKESEIMKPNNLSSTNNYKKSSNSATIPHSFSKETWKNYNHIFEISDSKSLPPPYLYENLNQEPTNDNIFSNLLSKFDGTFKKNEETSKANPSKPLFIPNKTPPIPKKVNENMIDNIEITAIPTKKQGTLNSILKNPLPKQKNLSVSIAKESKESFPSPSSNLKNKLYEWLLSINLIKDNIKVNLNKFHKICRNGVIFADIINRIESKNEVLTGIARKPKKTAEIHANYTKVFDFLAKFEKMNKRCLYCYEAFLEGKEESFWAFLDDIWHFYHNKMSKYDIRYQNTKALSLNESRRLNSSIKKTEVSNTSYEEIICPNQTINNYNNNFQMSNTDHFYNKNFRDQNNNSIISLVKGNYLES